MKKKPTSEKVYCDACGREHNYRKVKERRVVAVEIDMCNDFADLPMAALPVPGFMMLVGPIALVEEMSDTVIVFHDWHYPDDPVSAREFEVYGAHCVPGTWGSQRAPGLTRANAMMPKRTTNAWDAIPGTMNEQYVMRSLEEAEKIVVVGVVTGICVKDFVEGAISRCLGPKVAVIEDCVANLTAPGIEATNDLFNKWRKAGVSVWTVEDFVNWRNGVV